MTFPYLITALFFSFLTFAHTQALNDVVRTRAYTAYNPYKDSFRFFWSSLTEEQKISLKKSLITHKNTYLASKHENSMILGKKKIWRGVVLSTLFPLFTTLFATIVIIYLKDYNVASITTRSSFAAVCSAGIGAMLLYGLKKIYSGMVYKKRVDMRVKRDEILLEKIERYEQEIN